MGGAHLYDVSVVQQQSNPTNIEKMFLFSSSQCFLSDVFSVRQKVIFNSTNI